jgi:hypothetical protein
MAKQEMENGEHLPHKKVSLVAWLAPRLPPLVRSVGQSIHACSPVQPAPRGVSYHWRVIFVVTFRFHQRSRRAAHQLMDAIMYAPDSVNEAYCDSSSTHRTI